MGSTNGSTLDATLAAFHETDPPGTPLTASEVAEELDCSRRAAYDRLMQLSDRGTLETKKVGARGRIWWRPVATADSDVSQSQAMSLVTNVIEDVEVGAFVLDADFDVVWANDTVERYFGLEDVDIVGRSKHELIDEHIRDVVADAETFTETVFESYEENASSRSFECHVTPEDRRERWLEHRSRPIETGRYAGGRVELYYDVTERRRTSDVLNERERELRRERDLVEQILESSPVGISVLSREGDLERANERAQALRGVDPDEDDRLVAAERDIYDETGEPVADEDRPFYRVTEKGEPVRGWEIQLAVPGENRRWLSINATPIRNEDGDVERVVTTSQDVTQLKEQALRLERQQADLRRELDEVFERIDDAFYALDDDWRFAYVNERAEDMLGTSAPELLGREFWEVFPKADDSRTGDAFHRAIEQQESVMYEEYLERLDVWLSVTAYPSESGLSVYFRDVTDRKERELELQRYERIIETIEDGVYVLDADSRIVTVNSAFEKLTGYDREELVGQLPSLLVIDDEDVEHAETLHEELRANDRSTARFEEDIETRDGDRLTVEARFALYEMGDGETGRVGVIRDISDRIEYQNHLERQREQLSALNDLNAIVRDITTAVIEQSTRQEIETTVCQRLAESDAYEFAWLAEVDPRKQSIEPLVEAGVDGYLDAIQLSADFEESVGRGPAGRAVQTEEIQVVEDVFDDPDFAPWLEQAREYGYSAAAAIPILYEGTLYAILGVYADRDGAFQGQERTVVGQLGDIVGHAIASIERKRALMSDEVVELQFRVRDVFEWLDVSSTTDGSIALEQTIPLSDDEYLVYGTATGDSTAALEELVAEHPAWESLTVIAETDDRTRFEFVETDSTLTATIGDHGGYVQHARFEDGDYNLTVHLAPSGDVRTIIDAVRESYPGAEMVTRRQVSRTADVQRKARRAVMETMTDRQLATLEAAYYAGFFDSPRESSGGEVADSLDISAPTFHSHIRKAERKLVAALLGEDIPGDA
ncbi:PAS domain S-box protein [Halomicrococcus gelatinilyticus]|uniref:PAS domain S-box protein n=1 Tax=Halomicrococcus gelatinilyticus TaxID=1702103 RepID=UPI002E143253